MIQIDPQTLNLVPESVTLSRSTLSRFLTRARSLVELPGEVELLLTTDAELKRLNRVFRNKNKATDILSFPAPPEIAEHHAGDLAISIETASRQAAHFGHTLVEELRILILHGLLHLSGLDHETDAGEMAARESKLRTALKLPTSLIARVTIKTKSMPSPSMPSPMRKSLHSGRSEGPLPRVGSKKNQPKKRVEGPSNISLGQRHRSMSPHGAKKAGTLTQRSPRKSAKKAAR